MSYDNPINITSKLLAETISSSGVKRKITGPAGLTGRVESITALVTTGTTDAATIISVGTSGDADAFASVSVPVLSADGIASTLISGVTALIPADSVVEISSDGGCTAGAANLEVTIAWF